MTSALMKQLPKTETLSVEAQEILTSPAPPFLKQVLLIEKKVSPP